MREAIFAERRQAVASLARDILLVVREQGIGLDAERRRDAQGAIDRLVSRFSYCPDCAADVASLLIRRRFQDLVL